MYSRKLRRITSMLCAGSFLIPFPVGIHAEEAAHGGGACGTMADYKYDQFWYHANDVLPDNRDAGAYVPDVDGLHVNQWGGRSLESHSSC